MPSPTRVLPPIVAATLLAAALVEALAALQVFRPVGQAPGEAPVALDVAIVGGLFAIVAAAVLCGRAAFARSSSRWLVALPALAALLLMTHAFGFDPYDAPSLVRFWKAETRGNHEWIALLCSSGLAASALQWRWRRLGSALASPLLLVIALTYAFIGAGH
jgi:hypothetical protein